MDLEQVAVGSHNCLTDPIDDALNDGVTTRQTDIRPASSISTAFQLTAVNFQCQSLNQFGGISASHLDWTMVSFFRISFFKHYIDGLRYIEKLSENKINKFTKQFNILYKETSDGYKLYSMDDNKDIESNLTDDSLWTKFLSVLKMV